MSTSRLSPPGFLFFFFCESLQLTKTKTALVCGKDSSRVYRARGRVLVWSFIIGTSVPPSYPLIGVCLEIPEFFRDRSPRSPHLTRLCSFVLLTVSAQRRSPSGNSVCCPGVPGLVPDERRETTCSCGVALHGCSLDIMHRSVGHLNQELFRKSFERPTRTRTES